MTPTTLWFYELQSAAKRARRTGQAICRSDESTVGTSEAESTTDALHARKQALLLAALEGVPRHRAVVPVATGESR